MRRLDVVGQDRVADIARRVRIGHRERVQAAVIQRDDLAPRAVVADRRRTQQRAVLEDLDRGAGFPITHQGLDLVGDDADRRVQDAHVRGDRVHRDRTGGIAYSDVAGDVGGRDADIGRALMNTRLHRVGGRVAVAAIVDHRRGLAVDRDARHDIGRGEGLGDDVARLSQHDAVGVVGRFRTRDHGRCDRVDGDIACKRQRRRIERLVVRDDLNTRGAIHIIRLDGVCRRVLVARHMRDARGLAIDRDAVDKHRHASHFGVEGERLGDDVASLGPGSVCVVGDVGHLRDRRRQRVNRHRTPEGDDVGVARIIVHAHDHVGQPARVGDLRDVTEIVDIRAQRERIEHVGRDRLAVDRDAVNRDANARRGRRNRELADNHVARGRHVHVMHVERRLAKTRSRRNGGSHRHRARVHIHRHVAGRVMRRDHHRRSAARVAREHGVGCRVVTTAERLHRCRLAVDRDAVDRIGRTEGLGDDVARLGKRCGVVA